MRVLDEGSEIAFEGCTPLDVEGVVVDPSNPVSALAGLDNVSSTHLLPDISWIFTAVVPIT